MNEQDRIKFLESLIDKLILRVVTNSGGGFISRAAFNRQAEQPGAPKDYSYDEYVMDCCDDES